MGLIGDVVVGILAGWVTGMVRRGRGYGLVGNLVVGAVGAWVGGFLVGIIGFEPESLLAGVITAVAGAAGLLYLVDRVWQRTFQVRTEPSARARTRSSVTHHQGVGYDDEHE